MINMDDVLLEAMLSSTRQTISTNEGAHNESLRMLWRLVDGGVYPEVEFQMDELHDRRVPTISQTLKSTIRRDMNLGD